MTETIHHYISVARAFWAGYVLGLLTLPALVAGVLGMQAWRRRSWLRRRPTVNALVALGAPIAKAKRAWRKGAA